MNEDEIREYIREQLAGLGELNGAANTVTGRLMQLANGVRASADATNEDAMQKRRSTAAADGLVKGFKTLGQAAGTIVTSMVTIPSAMATSTEAFTAVKPVVDLVASTLKSLIGATTEIIGGFVKFVPFVGKAIDGLGEFAKALIDLGVKAVNFQLDATQRLINNFNQLSKAGFVFGASLEEAKRAADAGGMSLQTFTNVVSGQAANLALLGGNSEQAATLIVGAGKQMSSGLRTIFGGFEGLNTELIETVALQQSLGVTASRNQTELAKNTEPYLLNLKEISLLTGKSVQQTREEMRQRAQSAAFQNAYAQESATAQQNLTNAFSQLTPQARAYAEELFAAQAVGADITSESNLKLQALAPALTDKIRSLVALKDLPPEEFKRRQAALLQELGTAGKDLQKQFGYELFLQSVGRAPAIFEQLNKTVSEVISNSGRLTTAVAAQADAARKLGKIQNTFSTTIDDVNKQLQKLQSRIESIALGKFDTTASIVQLSIRGAVLLSQGLDKITDILGKFIPSSATTTPTPPAPRPTNPAPSTPPNTEPTGPTPDISDPNSYRGRVMEQMMSQNTSTSQEQIRTTQAMVVVLEDQTRILREIRDRVT